MWTFISNWSFQCFFVTGWYRFFGPEVELHRNEVLGRRSSDPLDCVESNNNLQKHTKTDRVFVVDSHPKNARWLHLRITYWTFFCLKLQVHWSCHWILVACRSDMMRSHRFKNVQLQNVNYINMYAFQYHYLRDVLCCLSMRQLSEDRRTRWRARQRKECPECFQTNALQVDYGMSSDPPNEPRKIEYMIGSKPLGKQCFCTLVEMYGVGELLENIRKHSK